MYCQNLGQAHCCKCSCLPPSIEKEMKRHSSQYSRFMKTFFESCAHLQMQLALEASRGNEHAQGICRRVWQVEAAAVIQRAPLVLDLEHQVVAVVHEGKVLKPRYPHGDGCHVEAAHLCTAHSAVTDVIASMQMLPVLKPKRVLLIFVCIAGMQYTLEIPTEKGAPMMLPALAW